MRSSDLIQLSLIQQFKLHLPPTLWQNRLASQHASLYVDPSKAPDRYNPGAASRCRMCTADVDKPQPLLSGRHKIHLRSFHKQ